MLRFAGVSCASGGRLTVELSCGPATTTRTNTRHCTGLTVSAAQRAVRQLQRVVRRREAGARKLLGFALEEEPSVPHYDLPPLGALDLPNGYGNGYKDSGTYSTEGYRRNAHDQPSNGGSEHSE